MNDADRRVVRTRRLLKEALLALISEKQYERITIRDVTDRADIGYATFFRHYDGVDDLMLEVFTEIIEELESLPKTHNAGYFEREGYALFQHVEGNHAMYRGVLESQMFSKKLKDYLSEMVQVHMDRHNNLVPAQSIPFEIAANHMVSSIMGLIDWWITNAMPYSKERMAVVYERLVIRATWHALNPDHALRLPWEDFD